MRKGAIICVRIFNSRMLFMNKSYQCAPGMSSYIKFGNFGCKFNKKVRWVLWKLTWLMILSNLNYHINKLWLISAFFYVDPRPSIASVTTLIPLDRSGLYDISRQSQEGVSPSRSVWSDLTVCIFLGSSWSSQEYQGSLLDIKLDCSGCEQVTLRYKHYIKNLQEKTYQKFYIEKSFGYCWFKKFSLKK